MPINITIQQHPDADGVYVGMSQCLVGDHIASYDNDADETTGYPCTLVDGRSTVDDDRDRDELRSTLRALGYDTETDSEGLVLVVAR